ncbi:Acetylcholinesterase-1 like protein [Argiope bruennichi]|uniref:Carboxylic ester hydrolase n=1 Tax=Argiope bruennichi TaxID=94029 RepID=A0A8T0EFM9_ARGBR|nr:Acetylcholinesterase-1 like protein [Argiope bruennichi]
MKIITLVYLIAILWPASGISGPVVTTPLGKIEGVISTFGVKPVKMFLGVPFAQPPLGNLRFLKPQPVQPWSDVYQAKTQPPACMQYSESPFPWYDNMTGKSEDCLYLNIYAPVSVGYKFAVIFWIYGGGFTFGSNRMEVYDARPLVAQGGVIVVTINYRLGALGFLTSNTSDAPGNMAMYDMLMALRWVNDYIEYFGGDKDRITIAGESAGSIAVSALCISPLSRGMFSRAIMQSASIIMFKYNELGYNLDLSERLAEAVGCATKNFTIYNHPTEVVQCLRTKNATYLTKTLWSFNPLSARSFFTQYGDEFLPNNAIDDIKNGNFQNVPLLAGDVGDEGAFQITTAHPDQFGFFGEKDPKVNKTYASSLLEGLFKNYTDPQKYIDFYLKDVPDEDYDLIRSQLSAAFGDSSILCETVYFAESYAERKNDVYYYFFTYRPSNSPWAKWMGAVHFEDVQFVFGRPVRVRSKEYDTKDIWVSEQVMKIWANFAKNGRPGVYPEWPKYSKENHTYYTIDTDTFGDLGTGPHLESCNMLRSYFGF